MGDVKVCEGRGDAGVSIGEVAAEENHSQLGTPNSLDKYNNQAPHGADCSNADDERGIRIHKS